MASNVDLTNTALAHLGQDAQVTSIEPPDGSPEAGYAKRFLAMARREMIETYEWNFTLRRARLAPLAENLNNQWTFSYATPADCIKPRRIPTPGLLMSDSIFAYAPGAQTGIIASSQNSAPFAFENGVLYTNEPEAELVYQVDVPDPNKFTPMFFSALSYLLAAYLAGPIVRGKAGVASAQNYRQLALAMANNAAVSDANSASEHHDFTPGSVAAR